MYCRMETLIWSAAACTTHRWDPRRSPVKVPDSRTYGTAAKAPDDGRLWLFDTNACRESRHDGTPQLFRTSIRQRPSGVWLESAIRYALVEATSEQAGSGVVPTSSPRFCSSRRFVDISKRCPTGRPAGWPDCAIRWWGAASRCCTTARKRLDSGLAGAISLRLAHGAGRAVRGAGGYAADAVFDPLAHRARGASTAQWPPQHDPHCRGGRLRIGGRVQPRLQA